MIPLCNLCLASKHGASQLPVVIPSKVYPIQIGHLLAGPLLWVLQTLGAQVDRANLDKDAGYRMADGLTNGCRVQCLPATCWKLMYVCQL